MCKTRALNSHALDAGGLGPGGHLARPLILLCTSQRLGSHDNALPDAYISLHLLRLRDPARAAGVETRQAANALAPGTPLLRESGPYAGEYKGVNTTNHGAGGVKENVVTTTDLNTLRSTS